MIVVDSNVLIYAYNTEGTFHAESRRWLENALSGSEVLGLPWSVIQSFLRLTTSRLFPSPLTISASAGIVDEWLAAPNVSAIVPGPRHWLIFRRILENANVRGNLVNDAHIAALAIENNASVCTADRDFRRFEGLRIINPVA